MKAGADIEHGRKAYAEQAPSVESIQKYVDSTLGDSSENTCYEVDADQAFSRQPLGTRESAAVSA